MAEKNTSVDTAEVSAEATIELAPVVKRSLGKKIAKIIKEDWQIYVLLAPLMIWLAIFSYKPMYGLLIAFQDFNAYKGMSGSDWVGFAKFQELFLGRNNTDFMYAWENNNFWRAFRNTLEISLTQLVFTFPLPIILALFFNEIKDGLFRRGVQTVMFLPHFLSEVILCGIITSFVQPNTGIINVLLIRLGIIDTGIYFLTRPEWFRPVYIYAGIWQGVGFGSIVYFAALSGISPELYEAATVDGATKLQKMLFISLPGIAPTISIMLIIRIGNILNIGYERVLLLYQPVTYSTADVLSTYIYRMGMAQSPPEYSMAAAAGLFNSVIGFILVIGANKASKYLSDTALW